MPRERMRHLIRIESPVRNDRQEIINWREFAIAYADIRGLSFQEETTGEGYVSHRCFIRYVPGVAHDMRVVWNPDGPLPPMPEWGSELAFGRVLEITSVIESPDRRTVELRLVETKKVTVS